MFDRGTGPPRRAFCCRCYGVETVRSAEIEPWSFKLLARLFRGVNFPMAVQGSDRDRPDPIAGFDP